MLGDQVAKMPTLTLWWVTKIKQTKSNFLSFYISFFFQGGRGAMGGVEHREGSGIIGMEGGAWGREWNILLFSSP